MCGLTTQQILTMTLLRGISEGGLECDLFQSVQKGRQQQQHNAYTNKIEPFDRQGHIWGG